MGKRWSKINDFPNYKVSSEGEVVNLTTGKQLATPIHKHGYLCVRLWHKGKTRLLKLYRILAIAFIPNPENKREVNHLDGNRMNHSLSNLEWATPSENMKHAYLNGLSKGHFKKGFNHQFSKVSESDVLEIRRLRRLGMRLKDIGKKFNITPDHTCRITKNKFYSNV
jgi:hypothetical protein